MTAAAQRPSTGMVSQPFDDDDFWAAAGAAALVVVTVAIWVLAGPLVVAGASVALDVGPVVDEPTVVVGSGLEGGMANVVMVEVEPRSP